MALFTAVQHNGVLRRAFIIPLFVVELTDILVGSLHDDLFVSSVRHYIRSKHSRYLTPVCRRTYAPASAWLPLFYDTVVFGLTLYRSIEIKLMGTFKSHIMNALLNEGLMYYRQVVLLAANLM